MTLQPDSEGRYTKTLNIKTLDVKTEGSNSLSEFVQTFKEYSKTNNPQDVIYKTMDRINEEVARIEKTNDISENVTRIKRALSGVSDIPEVKTQAYSNATALANALTTIVPPTPKAIFETWDRISNNLYYPKGEGATGEAAAWIWNESLNSMQITVNSDPHLGFVSDDTVLNYRHEATMRSTDADDDNNGLILAFNRNDTSNDYLYLEVNRGTDQNRHNVLVAVMSNGTTRNVILNVPTDNVWSNWSGAYKRALVERRGDFFHIQVSKWNNVNYEPGFVLNFSLTDDPRFEQFRGPRKYGYYNQSQAYSFWEDIRFYDGFLRDVIIDINLNEVYKYRLNSGWNKLVGVKIQDIYGSPRVITNADGSERYRLNDDYSIDIL